MAQVHSENWRCPGSLRAHLALVLILPEAQLVSSSPHLFQNFPQFIVIHTVKGFGIVNKAEKDVFLELSCFFHDPADVGDLISGSSGFSQTSTSNSNIKVFFDDPTDVGNLIPGSSAFSKSSLDNLPGT